MVSTGVSGPSRARAPLAAASTWAALVAMMTRSQGPTVAGSDVAPIRTVRPPLAPSSRSPLAAMASTWACQVSIAQTSLPASAMSAA